jgi:predicted pyridoxine 5'-phosphate oxidase superfamily flavin-nucleotide-binding protein
MTTPEITLHGTKLSGHVHRVELLLELLALPYRYVETNAEDRASPA